MAPPEANRAKAEEDGTHPALEEVAEKDTTARWNEAGEDKETNHNALVDVQVAFVDAASQAHEVVPDEYASSTVAAAVAAEGETQPHTKEGTTKHGSVATADGSVLGTSKRPSPAPPHELVANSLDASATEAEHVQCGEHVGDEIEDPIVPLSPKRQRSCSTSSSAKKKNLNFPPPKKLNHEQWDIMFGRLVQYKEQHGDCLVPKRYSAEPKLGTWVETQRVQYKRLKRTPALATAEVPGEDDEVDAAIATEAAAAAVTPSKRLNAERLGRLESIGFAWSAKNRKRPSSSFRTPAKKKYNDIHWNEMYDRLVKYKEKHGDCLVPKKYADDPKLGTWVETQRVLYNRHCKSSKETTLNPTGVEENDTSKDAHSSSASLTVSDVVMANAAAAVVADAAAGVEGIAAEAAAEAAAAVVEAKSPEEWAEEMEKAETARIATAAVAAMPGPEPGRCHEAGVVEQCDPSAVTVAAGMVLDHLEGFEGVVTRSEGETGKSATEKPRVKGVVGGDLETTGVDDTQDGTTELHQEAENLGMAQEDVPDTNIGKLSTRRLTKERKDKLEALGFVWSLRAKRVEDHWDDMFKQLLEYKEKWGDCLVPSRYEENMKLGKWVETQRYEYTKLRRASALLEAEKLYDGDAVAKAAAIGDPSCTAPKTPVTLPKGSGGKSGRGLTLRLTEERLRRLEAVGFEWKVKNKMKRYYDKQWDAMFENLLKFKEVNGNCLVPKRYPPDMKLGTWVHTQRIQYRKLKAGATKKEEEQGDDNAEESEVSFRLTEDRKRRLEGIGFVWSVRDKEATTKEAGSLARNSYDDQWDANFERLKEYKNRHGHCLVPKRCEEDQKLGTWVDTQRVQYKKMKRQIAKSAIAIEKVAVKVEEATEASASHVKSASSGKPLVGRLTDDRINRLESLGFVWSLRDDWQKHYDELIQYKKEHGDCNVPARYQKNRRLGIWVSAQRQQYKLMNIHDDTKPRRSAPLTMERVNLLNQLDFTWTIRSRDSLGDAWNERLEELRAYKKEHGNTLVPSRYPPNPELGVWVGTQRTQYRLYIRAKEGEAKGAGDGKAVQSSAMNDARIAQLEDLGFVWALRGSSDSLWKKRMNELRQYKNFHGNCAVPAKYKPNPRLGTWVQNIRAQYRLQKEKGKVSSSLDDDKVAELNALGFSWGAAGEVVGDASVTSVVAPAMPVIAGPNPEASTVQVAAQLAAAGATTADPAGVSLPLSAAGTPTVAVDLVGAVATTSSLSEMATARQPVEAVHVAVSAGVGTGGPPTPQELYDPWK